MAEPVCQRSAVHGGVCVQQLCHVGVQESHDLLLGTRAQPHVLHARENQNIEPCRHYYFDQAFDYLDVQMNLSNQDHLKNDIQS